MTSAGDPPPRAAQRRGRRQPRIVNRRPATKQHPGHKPMKRRAWRPLREIMQQRAPPSVRRAKPARMVMAWQPPQRRGLFHYAALIEATPTREDTTAAVNRQARTEQRHIEACTHADRQARQRAQWRQEADAIARHRRRHEGRTEDVRRVKEGLRAERQATDAGAPLRKLALYRQLAAIMGQVKL